jgi:cation diffusion facilitator CzcD-associated flavoprotein CzcO
MRDMNGQRNRRVAVIGAGASGICAAKYLLQAGLDVQVFEIGTRIGGLWVYENDNGRSSAYASLHINSEKRNTQFSDFPFAPDIQYFPNHHDMAKYLHAYADRYSVTERIRFNAEVKSVVPRLSGDGKLSWAITTARGETEAFDAVVVGTGHLSIPIDPDWARDFSGEYLHSHYYRVPAPFLGKRVLVVGKGNSGCDIAADLCVYASRTVMLVRSPELIVPKIFLGVPVTQVTGFFTRKWLPASVPQLVRRIITRLVHGRMESWGIETPKGVTHPISHATLINHIAYRRVEVKRTIAKVSGKTVTFGDGTAEDLDVIIGATGYEIDYPFVAPELLPLQDGRADLYKRIVPVGWPGLYYIGLFNTLGSSNLRMFEEQSKWIAAIERGQIILPSRAEMRRDIDARNAYIARRFPPGRRHAIEVEPVPYTRELERERRAGAERLARLRRQGAVPDAVWQSRSIETLGEWDLPARLPDRAALPLAG